MSFAKRYLPPMLATVVGIANGVFAEVVLRLMHMITR
jgi:hypothetical protein